MGILSQNPRLTDNITEKILCWMQESGVQVCMEQGSVNFENFIQVKLAGFLSNRFKQYIIKVETHEKKYNADILIVDKNVKVEGPIAAIQLKIVSLANKRNCLNMRNKKKTGIVDDIEKLNAFQGCDRLLICVVYQFEKNHSYSWGAIKGDNKQEANYREKIIKELPSEDKDKNNNIPALVSFGNKSGCVDVFVF